MPQSYLQLYSHFPVGRSTCQPCQPRLDDSELIPTNIKLRNTEKDIRIVSIRALGLIVAVGLLTSAADIANNLNNLVGCSDFVASLIIPNEKRQYGSSLRGWFSIFTIHKDSYHC